MKTFFQIPPDTAASYAPNQPLDCDTIIKKCVGQHPRIQKIINPIENPLSL